MINQAKKNFILINAVIFICYVLLAAHMRNKKKAEEEELLITGLPAEEEVVEAEIAEVEQAMLNDIKEQKAKIEDKNEKQGEHSKEFFK